MLHRNLTESLTNNAIRVSFFKALDEIGEVTAASRQLEAANAIKEEIILAGAMSDRTAGGGQLGVVRPRDPENDEKEGKGIQPAWAAKSTV